MLDYKLLEALAMVVREGGFEKGAKVLRLTQSAVSQRIRQLEDKAGQVLLARSVPPRATPAGLRLLKHYRQVKLLEDGLAEETGGETFTSLSLGVNADSLSTWFLEAVRPFLEEEEVVLDLHVEDQDQTHRLLKNGDVIGCVSAAESPMQGCRSEYLGRMNYRMVATPDFAARRFPEGLTVKAILRAPALIYSSEDNLHGELLRQLFEEPPPTLPAHYMPSPEKFLEVIASGLAYGMVPDQQGAPLLQNERIVDLAPGRMVSVRLHWHCWNLESSFLSELTRRLVAGARRRLED